MEVEGKARKQNEVYGRFEKQQGIWQWVVFGKRNNCIGVLCIHRKQFRSLAFSGFQSSRKRIWKKTSQWHVTKW